MPLLTGLDVLQIGGGLASAVCGRLLADVGARVACIGRDRSTPLARYLDHGKAVLASLAEAGGAKVVICEGAPSALRRQGFAPDALKGLFPDAALVCISPFGQTGPDADRPASDLTLFAASGIARMLTGQVDNLAEPPIRAVGEQSAFVGGIAAACAGMHAALLPQGSVVDISMQEALATLAMTELSRAGLDKGGWSRKRLKDGNGATVTILPARDGYAAISPREDHQWAAWLAAMGNPAWGAEPRFATKRDRVENWDALHALMSEWSRCHDKQWIADTAQSAHVPSFPLREPAEQLESPQLGHRGFYRDLAIDGRTTRVPGPAFGLTLVPGPVKPMGGGPLPLSGVRVLDFSWVIAGPTATRYLAAMGAEVIKVEAPGRGDPGRASELHTVLGQAKRGIVLNLKRPEAVETARRLARNADVVIENFATGVMDRLGLGAADLQRDNPDLVYVSASGLGRTGPEAKAVAYGTLLQCYAGFAGLNRHPDVPPRIGMAWLDPMCGLKLAFITAAAIWRRNRAGGGARVDFSMIEAMLWTMAKPLIEAQLGATPRPQGNASDAFSPHGVYRCAGDDAWLAVAVTGDTAWQALCTRIPALVPMRRLGLPERQEQSAAIDQQIADWLAPRSAEDAARLLLEAGIAAAPVAFSTGLAADPHLRARGFWEEAPGGHLPGLPWRASFGRATGPAPALGADTDAVLRDVLGLADAEIGVLRTAGALG